MQLIKHGGLIIFTFEQTRSFCLQKSDTFTESSDLKMLQHRSYTENCLCKQGNIVIRYIEVDFTFGLPDYVRYIEEFVIQRFVTSRFYSIHFTVTLART